MPVCGLLSERAAPSLGSAEFRFPADRVAVMTPGNRVTTPWCSEECLRTRRADTRIRRDGRFPERGDDVLDGDPMEGLGPAEDVDAPGEP
jgi:hypothetical protein